MNTKRNVYADSTIVCDGLTNIRKKLEVGNGELFERVFEAATNLFLRLPGDRRTKEHKEQSEIIEDFNRAAKRLITLYK